MGMDTIRIGGTLGAEVHGVDLTGPVDDATGKAIDDALLEHKVLFFPGQHLDRDQHVAFGRRFGELEVFHPQARVDGEDTHPEILSLRSDKGLIADVWHTDVTWMPSPPVASIVNMVQTPNHGGDTLWSNQEAAYAALTAPMKELLSGLTACNSGRIIGRGDAKADHPVVRRHPVTGTPGLYVNRQFTTHIVELSPQESDALLPMLFAWCEQPRFHVRYHWSAGTVAVWDNRCTMHHVANDFDGTRVLERVTVLGDEPEPAAELRWEAYDYGHLSAAAGDAIWR